MSQPIWKLIAQLGDVNPLEYGGYFIYQDTTGVYAEEAEFLDVGDPSEGGKLVAYRVMLDRCTFIGGILSDNKFHPDKPAWFAKPESERAERPQDTTYLADLAKSSGVTVEELARLFCSEDARERAVAYRFVAENHSWDEFDTDPLTLTPEEAKQRYTELKPV